MNKTEVVDIIAQEAGITKAAAKGALEAVLKATSDALGKGDSVSLVGFGTFSVKERKARTGMNPKTRAKIQIPACKVVRFKPGADLEKRVK